MGLEMEETANDERMKNELIESAKGKPWKFMKNLQFSIHEKTKENVDW